MKLTHSFWQLLIVTSILVHAELSSGLPGRRLAGQRECPVGCLHNKCVEDKTTGTFVCTKCANNLMRLTSGDPSKRGMCACRPGRYYEADGGADSELRFGHKPRCTLCDKGNYCPGGVIDGSTSAAAANSVPQKSCAEFGTGLTTTGRAAKSKWGCVELPGYGYSVSNANPKAIPCSGDTYNPGYGKQSCQSCPSGFEISDELKNSAPVAAKHNNVTDCLAPPGYYLRSPSSVAPCPQGQYQPHYNRAAKCLSCPAGVTTQPAGSSGSASRVFSSMQFCNTLKPGYFATSLKAKNETINSGSSFYIDQAAEPCPQKHWCPGGMPETSYSGTGLPDQTSLVRPCTTENGVAAGKPSSPLWTKGLGASSRNECLVPPGYGLDGSGDLTKCQSGTFREGWVAATSATSPECITCAADSAGAVTSAPSERLAVFPTTNADNATSEEVIASANACRMEPGFGMYQTATGFRVSACNDSNYGSAEPTFGRNFNPCRQCPATMVGLDLASADASIKNANGTGFISPSACVTKPGFGWDGRTSTQCPVGSYNPGGNRDECTPCPFGYSTPNDPNQQRNASDCKVDVGFQSDSAGEVQECPLGTYSDSLKEVGVPCTPCPNSTWTSTTGSDDLSDCSLCLPGYGRPANASTNTPCIDCAKWPAGAAYGPADRDSTECITCPTQTQGFTYFYLSSDESYTSPAIIKPAQTSASSCLSEFAQIEPGLWRLLGVNRLRGIFTPPEGFQQCISLCKEPCVYLSYDYNSGACTHRWNYPGDWNAVIAFKALSSGDVMGAQSKAVATGMYVQWAIDLVDITEGDLGLIGPLVPAAAATKGTCMEACDFDVKCAAIVIPGTINITEPPDTLITTDCIKVYGWTEGVRGTMYARSLTHVVVDRLT